MISLICIQGAGFDFDTKGRHELHIGKCVSAGVFTEISLQILSFSTAALQALLICRDGMKTFVYSLIVACWIRIAPYWSGLRTANLLYLYTAIHKKFILICMCILCISIFVCIFVYRRRVAQRIGRAGPALWWASAGQRKSPATAPAWRCRCAAPLGPLSLPRAHRVH